MRKFQVGDRVRVKEVEVGSAVGKRTFVDSMSSLCGRMGVVNVVRRCSDGEACVCGIEFDDTKLDGCWVYADEWLELVEAAVQVSSESLDLVSLLKGCVGVKLWSPLFGDCKLMSVKGEFPYCIVVNVLTMDGEVSTGSFTAGGCYLSDYSGSTCVLWPSRDCQTWDGWVAPRWRAKKGESYYYINSGLEVMEDIEEGGETKSYLSDLRFSVCNYFPTFEVAVAMAKRLGDVLQSE